MKYEGQDQQYRKGAWVGDNQWQESSYPNEQAQQFARATRKDMRTRTAQHMTLVTLAAVLGAGARRGTRDE